MKRFAIVLAFDKRKLGNPRNQKLRAQKIQIAKAASRARYELEIYARESASQSCPTILRTLLFKPPFATVLLHRDADRRGLRHGAGNAADRERGRTWIHRRSVRASIPATVHGQREREYDEQRGRSQSGHASALEFSAAPDHENKQRQSAEETSEANAANRQESVARSGCRHVDRHRGVRRAVGRCQCRRAEHARDAGNRGTRQGDITHEAAGRRDRNHYGRGLSGGDRNASGACGYSETRTRSGYIGCHRRGGAARKPARPCKGGIHGMSADSEIADRKAGYTHGIHWDRTEHIVAFLKYDIAGGDSAHGIHLGGHRNG